MNKEIRHTLYYTGKCTDRRRTKKILKEIS